MDNGADLLPFSIRTVKCLLEVGYIEVQMVGTDSKDGAVFLMELLDV